MPILNRRLALSILAALTVLAAPSAAAGAGNPVDCVDPRIGTGGHGHTFPGPTLPFGMVQLSPDTRLTGWDGCSGYHDSDRRVFGFSHTHLSGTGVSDYGDILLLPATGKIRWASGYAPADSARGYGSRFRKVDERASAGYYAVHLDDYEVTAELTATLRAGMHRYTFERGGPAHILLDLSHRDEVITSSLRVVGPQEIEGFRRSRAWAQNQRIYFVARFSRPVDALIAVDDQPHEGLAFAEGKNVKAALRFTPKHGEAVLVKVGISAVDIDGARRNLNGEIPGWGFESVHQAARDAWDEALGRIAVRGGTSEEETVFYTALYHALLQPNTYSDLDDRYRGRDDAIHTAHGRIQYTVFSRDTAPRIPSTPSWSRRARRTSSRPFSRSNMKEDSCRCGSWPQTRPTA
jgi:predicted alpha-1,2-mannosidase